MEKSYVKFVMTFYKSSGMSEVCLIKILQQKNRLLNSLYSLFLDSADVNLQLLDMRIFENKTYILAGAVNSPHTPQMYYGIGRIIL